jgi:spermidine synthase
MPVSGSVTLSESGGIRFLHFGTRVAQGGMFIDRQNSLALAYSQDMMAWLMFADPPAQITQLGLGAGSLAKFSISNFRQTEVIAVEISQPVIDVAVSSFKLPQNETRLSVVCGDAAEYIKRFPQHAGTVLLSDVFDAISAGPILDSSEFYADCERFVRGSGESLGMAVFNLWGSEEFPKSVEKISHAFDRRVVQLDRLVAGNIIVIAFTGPALLVSEKSLEKRAILLGLRYGLPAERWFNALGRAINRPVWNGNSETPISS